MPFASAEVKAARKIRPDGELKAEDLADVMKQKGGLDDVTKLIDEGRLAEGKRMLIHVIDPEDVIRELPGSSRLNNDWGLLCHLQEVGRARAGKWLAANFDHLGKESTVDLEAKYF